MAESMQQTAIGEISRRERWRASHGLKDTEANTLQYKRASTLMQKLQPKPFLGRKARRRKCYTAKRIKEIIQVLSSHESTSRFLKGIRNSKEGLYEADLSSKSASHLAFGFHPHMTYGIQDLSVRRSNV